MISIPLEWWIAPGGSIVALLFAYVFYRSMACAPAGEESMVRIAGYVKKALWLPRQQYKVVGIFFVVLSVILALWHFAGDTVRLVPFAFLSGGIFRPVRLSRNGYRHRGVIAHHAAASDRSIKASVAFRSARSNRPVSGRVRSA